MIEKNGITIKEGLNETLEYLREQNIKMAVATSTNRKRACSLLSNVNVLDYFSCIICGDEIEKCKPDPEIFLKVADKLGVSPENCLVLEDSEAGIAAAYTAGMVPVMIPDLKQPGEETEKILFKKLESLFDLRELFESRVVT